MIRIQITHTYPEAKAIMDELKLLSSSITHLTNIQHKINDSLTIINNQLNKIKMTQEELAQALTDLKAQTEKAKAEVLGKIADLENALTEAGSTTPAVDEALAALKTSVQGVDDIVPDAPPADQAGQPTDPGAV